MENITVSELEGINSAAYEQALEIMEECGCEEDDLDEDEFEVTVHGAFIKLAFPAGGFGASYPMWIWDPRVKEWVSNDTMDPAEIARWGDVFDRFNAV